MNKKLDFTFKIDGIYQSVNYYRSDAPMDPESMPVPTISGISGLSYADENAEAEKVYFVRFGAVGKYQEKISDEIIVSTVTEFFDPSALPTINILLDDFSEMTVTSNKLSMWKDRVTNAAFTQTKQSSMPLLTDSINSLPAFVFSGSYLETLNLAAREIWVNKKSIWAFCVYKCTLSNSQDKSIINIKTSDGSVGFSAEAGAPAAVNKPFAYGRIAGGQSLGYVADDLVSLNEWVFVFYEINFTGNTGRISVNGRLVSKQNLWGISQDKTEAKISAGLGVGGANSSVFNFGGSVASILLGSGEGPLTDIERIKLEGWAAHKYGLTAKLPSNHPYKVLKPTV